MLDITDNLVAARSCQPAGVRILDGEDPYLVVAADKGTATLSDTANAISESYGFWLGDAFASGGSAGYDHKKLGITARAPGSRSSATSASSATTSMTEPFTVVGVGDMSGDVFGNGMLLSPQIRLVGGVRPPPRVPRSRSRPGRRRSPSGRRLYDLPGSSWDDYDRAKICAGGGVYPLDAKSVPLVPAAARRARPRRPSRRCRRPS